MATTIKGIDPARVIETLGILCDTLEIAASQQRTSDDCRHTLSRAAISAATLAAYMGDDREAIVSTNGNTTTTDYLRQVFDDVSELREYVLNPEPGDYETNMPSPAVRLRRWLDLLKASERGEVAIDPKDVPIFTVLLSRHPVACLQCDLEANDAGSRKALGERLKCLREQGYIERQHGERGGDNLTPKGLTLAKKICGTR